MNVSEEILEKCTKELDRALEEDGIDVWEIEPSIDLYSKEQVYDAHAALTEIVETVLKTWKNIKEDDPSMKTDIHSLFYALQDGRIDLYKLGRRDEQTLKETVLLIINNHKDECPSHEIIIHLEHITEDILSKKGHEIVTIKSNGYYWRVGAKGYTSNIKEAWMLPLNLAYKQTKHSGPEKQIVFEFYKESMEIDPKIIEECAKIVCTKQTYNIFHELDDNEWDHLKNSAKKNYIEYARLVIETYEKLKNNQTLGDA